MKVEGISRRGKQKTKVNGEDITVVREGMVEFATGIHTLVQHNLTNSRRWIKKDGDIDFRITDGQ